MCVSASEGNLPFFLSSALRRRLTQQRRRVGGRRTVDSREQDPGVVVGDDVGVAVLWFVDLQVGVLPGELLTRVDGLWSRGGPVVTDRRTTEQRR